MHYSYMYYTRLMPSFKLDYILDQVLLGISSGCFPKLMLAYGTRQSKYFPQEPLI
jgi:hypothetical protein